MFETITHRIDDGILTITLNRPENLNAFVVTMGDELERSFREVNDDDNVRAVIVTGAGRAFCAGMDLNGEGNVFGLDGSRNPGLADLADLDDPSAAGVRDPGGRLTLAIHDCRKPVIAAINGAAVGVGATMTLAMDRRLVSTRGRIGLIFGRIGVTPEAASTWFLERIVGQAAALDLVLRADIIDADAAAAVGLVDEVVEPDALLARAVEIADAWTRNRSPVAVAQAKQMVRRNGALPHPADAHRIESLGLFWASVGDGEEGVAAFLEKRAPEFTSRASEMPAYYEDWIAQYSK
ncbi:crotonase/enoyl-CoA hydratase family protein [Nocardia cyriacigeorgica]|uniref:Crotonase/enoyl-CoA hydratase family protein n=1 Tax=Nocardia cyriacigeorgica TaxID=135487 RepID=A0A6P1CZ49_9NOCA|nr:crotonase/enoyl-CoA hydratase family protein [Nocardia cyriacigeorgica]NEW37705.1 crotonase/enoyl-CoA hydratase family protein [Nocardia cyriacigeorgica]NEW43297.1 crotonase/enoyl-CoA hydratase family protein [Nocardia cyriacigeorgica]NEW48909.1 crotonase/enoyl-CoA hydratase family protein [Nocardia cyriacigeorgica]NEW55010.1 crotonase/enoyl-CoA hydratase family protein [Nocardia cyriacigeorgica]